MRRRLVFLLGEPVAFGQRPDLVGADAVDQPVEMLADPRLGAPAVRRLEQHVDAWLNSCLARFDVAELELPLAGT